MEKVLGTVARGENDRSVLEAELMAKVVGIDGVEYTNGGGDDGHEEQTEWWS